MAEIAGPGALLADTLLSQSRTGPRFDSVKTADQARSAAEDFEAFFISQTLEHMFAGIATDGPFGGGHAEGMYRSMMNEEYGKAISRSGGFGIADAVYREIIKLQEIQP